MPPSARLGCISGEAAFTPGVLPCRASKARFWPEVVYGRFSTQNRRSIPLATPEATRADGQLQRQQLPCLLRIKVSDYNFGWLWLAKLQSDTIFVPESVNHISERRLERRQLSMKFGEAQRLDLGYGDSIIFCARRVPTAGAPEMDSCPVDLQTFGRAQINAVPSL